MYLAGFFITLGLNIIVLAVFYIMFTHRIAKSGQARYALNSVRNEVEEIITELNQTTDRNVDLIEDRIKQISGLIEKADKRITILKKEAEIEHRGEHRGPATYGNLRNAPVEKPKREMTKREKILDLHQQGFSSGIIAQQVGATIGEVELTISLMEGRSSI